MLRERLIRRHFGQEPNFRWRGKDVSRLEGFSDAVFGFLITILVISTEMPKTFNDLLDIFSFSNVGSFAICFVILVQRWRFHYTYFRRYGLENGPVVIFNTIFLCIITLYIYPLKFLFNWMLEGFPAAASGVPLTETLPIREDQVTELLVIYGAGLAFLCLSELGMYWWAYYVRAELQLTPLETYTTVTMIGSICIPIAIALLSIVIALYAGPDGNTWAGLIYLLLPPLAWGYGSYRTRARARGQATPPQTELHST